MPTVVAFPAIAESHMRATHEIIRLFFDGQIHNVGGVAIPFPNIAPSLLLQQLDKFEKVESAAIGILDTSVNLQRRDKCLMPDGSQGYETAATINREVVVMIPKAAADPDFNVRAAVAMWDKVYAVFSCMKVLFAERNIFNVVIEPIPSQVMHPKLAMVSGSYLSQIRVKHKLN